MNYYTPDISEFHVGFEYEHGAGKNDWFKTVFDMDDSLDEINVKLQLPDVIRIKYLDEDDILSLGFKDITLPQSIGKHFIYDEVRIMFTEELSIINGLDFVFRGRVKNKSELVVLLKQIGI